MSNLNKINIPLIVGLVALIVVAIGLVLFFVLDSSESVSEVGENNTEDNIELSESISQATDDFAVSLLNIMEQEIVEISRENQLSVIDVEEGAESIVNTCGGENEASVKKSFESYNESFPELSNHVVNETMDDYVGFVKRRFTEVDPIDPFTEEYFIDKLGYDLVSSHNLGLLNGDEGSLAKIVSLTVQEDMPECQIQETVNKISEQAVINFEERRKYSEQMLEFQNEVINSTDKYRIIFASQD